MQQIGLKPQRAAGQHFLLDEKVVEAMVEAANVQPGDTILEIGPGLGILTKVLLGRGANVVAVELDQRLYNYLQHTHKKEKKLQLIKSDIFQLNLDEILKDSQYKLVANLPYSSTSLVFRNFLTIPPRPISITVMIQKEVAQRITAKPGQMNMLGVMAQYFSRPVYLFDVPKTSFVPPPAVTSAVIQCRDIHQPNDTAAKTLLRVAKAGFTGRRKQLHNSLSAALHLNADVTEDKLAKAGIDPVKRAQDLNLADWHTITNILVD